MAPAKRHRIAPALERLAVPVDALSPYPGNARNGDLEAIGASIDAHGQYAPVVVQRSTGFVLKGNHVYAAIMERDWSHIAATYVDVDDATARRIVLVDNRTSDLGQYDPGLLADLLTDLSGDYDGSGYTDRDLTALLAQMERDAQRAIEVADEDTRGLGGAPVVSYTLVFDDAEQQNVWYGFLKWLRSTRPGDTIGERVAGYCAEVLEAETAPAE